MAENKIEIPITADVSDYKKAVGEAEKATDKLTSSIQSGMRDSGKEISKVSDGITSGIGGSIAKIGGGVALGNLITKGLDVAFRAIQSFTTDSVQAFSEQEDALNKLSFALRANGDFSVTALSNLSAFATEMQRTSKYGDETVLSMLALAKSFGATNEQAQQMVRAGADLSATFGGSLEERVEQLGKSFSGSAGKLGQLIPELKNLTASQLQAGDAVDVIASKLQGASQNEMNTHTGSVIAMKNAYSDFQEEIGGSISGSGFVRDSIEVLTVAFQKLTQAFADSKIENERANGTLTETEATIDQLKRKLDELRVYEIDTEQIILNPDFFDKVFRVDTAKQNLERVRGEISLVNKEIEEAIKKSDEAKAKSAQENGNRTPSSSGPTDEQLQVIAQEQALIDQKKVMMTEFQMFEDQLRIDQLIAQGEFNASEYETLLNHEHQKIEAIRQAELEKARIIKDASVRKATEDNINQKADLDRLKSTAINKKKMVDDGIKIERQEAQTKMQIAQNFASAGLALAKENSTAQKALLIAQAVMNTYTGATNALADVRPAFLAPAFAASMIAVGLANVAKIAGAKFETGGIVGGASYTGDKVGVRVNSGEMILNREQQRTLFDDINERRIGSGSGGVTTEILNAIRSMPIVVQANGREIARLVRDEKTSGFGV